MKSCLNQATLLTADLETFLKAAKVARFDAIELRTDKVQENVRRKGRSETSDLVRSSGLEVVSLNALENFSIDRPQFPKMMDQAKEMIEACEIVGCRTIIAISAPLLSGLKEQEAIERTRDALEKVVDLSSERGINVCFEFLGFKSRCIRTLEEAWQVVKGLASAEVHLVIDTFHFHVGGSSLGALEQTPTQRISIVHINDVERKPPEELLDGDRVLPGEGVTNPRLLTDRLKARSYAGPLSVELFCEDYWKQDPLYIARKARQSLEGLL